MHFEEKIASVRENYEGTFLQGEVTPVYEEHPTVVEFMCRVEEEYPELVDFDEWVDLSSSMDEEQEAKVYEMIKEDERVTLAEFMRFQAEFRGMIIKNCLDEFDTDQGVIDGLLGTGGASDEEVANMRGEFLEQVEEFEAAEGDGGSVLDAVAVDESRITDEGDLSSLRMIDASRMYYFKLAKINGRGFDGRDEVEVDGSAEVE